MPINLDSVLRLAEDHNAQIAVAREKVHEGLSEQELAARGWIPQTTAGIEYWRHEGGIPLEDGRLIHSSFGVLSPSLDIGTSIDVRQATIAAVDAERKVWQQRGELSRVSNETLLEAANTYLDLLAARRGEQIAQQLEKEQQDVLARAEKLATGDRSSQVLVEGVQTELAGRHQALSRLHHQGDAAAVKLAYLLGMGPEAMPVPIDPLPTPVDLVDATPPTADLVARALQSGPGIQELQRLLAVIQDGFDSPGRSPGPAADVHPGCLRRRHRLRGGRQHDLGQPLGRRRRSALEPQRVPEQEAEHAAGPEPDPPGPAQPGGSARQTDGGRPGGSEAAVSGREQIRKVCGA